MLNKTALLTTILITSTSVNAAPIDLSDWSKEGGRSKWAVQKSTDSVYQTYNSAPTVFFNSNENNTLGSTFNGNVKVNTRSDDDYVGFVLGYNNGEIKSSLSDYFLIDWKQKDQNYRGRKSKAGLSISHVTDSTTKHGFWKHDGGINEIQRAKTLGDTGWSDFIDYEFNILFTKNLIEVSVDNLVQLSITPKDVSGVSFFSDGAFGFYNYSQARVLYSSFSQVDCQATPSVAECISVGADTAEAPEPASIFLTGLGFLGIGAFSKKKPK